MTTPTPNHQRARAVVRAVGDEFSRDIPVHVAKRLGVVLQDEAAVFGDADVSTDEHAPPRTVTGRVVVLTESRVLLAEFTGSAGGSDRRDPPEEAQTVSCRTWARKSLNALDLLPGDDGENSDWAWQNEWSSDWPRGGAATLTYAGGQKLVLPMQPNVGSHERFALLLPSLLADLTRD
jgi:hypothetical protein